MNRVLDNMRGVVAPAEFADTERHVRELQVEALQNTPAGETARRRLDIMIRIQDLDRDQLLELERIMSAHDAPLDEASNREQ